MLLVKLIRTLFFHILSLSGLCSLSDGLCEQGHEFAIAEEKENLLASCSIGFVAMTFGLMPASLVVGEKRSIWKSHLLVTGEARVCTEFLLGDDLVRWFLFISNNLSQDSCFNILR